MSRGIFIIIIPMPHKLGAHLSINGGYEPSLSRIRDLGGNCLQIFSASPRGWNMARADKAAAEAFRLKKQELGIDPVYFHASYLINLADPGRIGHLSKTSLIAELQTASLFGIRGSVVHLGSFKNEDAEGKYPTLIKNIKEVLEQTPRDTLFIMENAGNRKIGQSIEELARIMQDVHDPRIRICLDTCHLFSAGYDLRTPETLDAFLMKIDAKIGLSVIEAWHVNDSRDPFGSLRDRHENIGEGTIGLEPFRLLLNHPLMKELPFIIETPGFDGNGPDRKNLEIIKSLV
jgi:deoxyribonuclease-4